MSKHGQHLHDEATTLDLNPVDGNVSLGNLVQKVGAVARQNTAFHGAGHAENDGLAVAVAHLHWDGQLAQHLGGGRDEQANAQGRH